MKRMLMPELTVTGQKCTVFRLKMQDYNDYAQNKKMVMQESVE